MSPTAATHRWRVLVALVVLGDEKFRWHFRLEISTKESGRDLVGAMRFNSPGGSDLAGLGAVHVGDDKLLELILQFSLCSDWRVGLSLAVGNFVLRVTVYG